MGVAALAVSVFMYAPPVWAQQPAGSSAVAGEAEQDVQNLRQRAAAFWAARIARDFRAQWELLEPRGRGRMAPEEYAAGRGAVLYLAYQVEDAEVNGIFGVVKVRVMVQPAAQVWGGRRVPIGATVVNDEWVRAGGVWYRRLEQREGGQATQQGSDPGGAASGR